MRVRDAKPDAIVLISYYADGALIVRQIRAVGLDAADRRERLGLFAEVHRTGAATPPTACSPKRISSPTSRGRRCRTSSRKFRARYHEEPDTFNAVAYDTIVLLAAVIDKYGDDRKAIHDGLAEIKDVPSVIFGKATFDPETRRVAGAARSI